MLAPDSGWTDERIAELQRLKASGLSASKIAEELGGVSRSAVLGKLHRLAGYRRKTAERRPISAAVPSSRHYKCNGGASATVSRGRQLKQAREIVLDGPPVAGDSLTDLRIEHIPTHRCTLSELEERRCRWPIGDPKAADFCYCGGPAPEGAPYCGYHARIAYQPAPLRKLDWAARLG